MLGLGGLSFAAPWVLLGLGALPVIWWIVRLSPPRPRRILFPATRLLRRLRDPEETPARTPWWLLVLRLVLAALAILALARPMLGESHGLLGTAPLLIVVDDGWSAAEPWAGMEEQVAALLDEAERLEIPVALSGTAPALAAPDLGFANARDIRQRFARLLPKPYAADRMGALERIAESAIPAREPQIVWVSDGLDGGSADTFAGRLAGFAGANGLTVTVPDAARLALALAPPAPGATTIGLSVYRPGSGPERQGRVLASGPNGRFLSAAPFSFAAGEKEAQASFSLPLELRNQIARFEIEASESAGATVLLDDRWRRKVVALISGSGFEDAQPLLSDLFYLQRALAPFAETKVLEGAGAGGDLAVLLRDASPSLVVLADVGRLPESERALIEDWVEAGGLLVRFAGPRLAAQSDNLVPVDLRRGGRALGGALSWATPQRLATFDDDSPFAGLSVPADVVVNRQVLAEPSVDLNDLVWARLTDGTPLVTSRTLGDGRLVLVHTSANTEWSNLALSGLFVEMLQRLAAIAPAAAGGEARPPSAGAVAGERHAFLAPVEVLDGYGRLVAPGPAAAPIARAGLDELPPGPRHPPGYYGAGGETVAFNLVDGDPGLMALTAPAGARFVQGRESAGLVDLRPPLLVAAFLLLIADGLAALWLTGALAGLRARFSGSAAALFASVALGSLVMGGDLGAEELSEEIALKAANETRLAFVRSGDAAADEMSLAGLSGLTELLNARTAVEPGEPVGVDIERDELSFFPFLYWPVTSGQPAPSPEAMARVDRYMKNGGLILFDTRDAHQRVPGSEQFGGGGNEELQRLLGVLDVPPLTPVPEDHVLTKSFYLLQTFPGRWADGELWVETRSADGDGTRNDGVSSIVIGANDFAAAWARDDRGRPLVPVVPGGDRQRELAGRFGINLVMYALTGNYKADQVHVPALLERLGQ